MPLPKVHLNDMLNADEAAEDAGVSESLIAASMGITMPKEQAGK